MTLNEVKNQYEDYPYPNRNPQDEKNRLIPTTLGNLERIQSILYGGKKLDSNFRILDAGCGTGDNTVFMAENLKNIGGKVVALDFSKTSLDITKERCEIRGLNNVEFINGSILDLPQMSLEKFDYIVCSGVLHHLKIPADGLKALQSVLKDNGFISLMVYAKYGRTVVYMTQELMRLVNENENEINNKIMNTKTVVQSYHDKHWNQLDELHKNEMKSDIGIYDMYLHSQDRAYTIKELHGLAKDCNLNFFHVFDSFQYEPSSYLNDPELINKINSLPRINQLLIGELLHGKIAKHKIILSKDSLSKTNYLDTDYSLIIPKILLELNPEVLDRAPRIILKPSNFEIKLSDFNKQIFRYCDGKRTVHELIEIIKEKTGVNNEDTIKSWKIFVEKLLAVDLIAFSEKDYC